MEKQRIYYWDNLKAILIFLVVLSHFLLPVVDEGRLLETSHFFIYIFHMPAFVFVTGYFAKKYMEKDVPQVNRLLGILILFIVYKILIWATKSLLATKFVQIDFLGDKSAPWYLLAMFFWFIYLPLFAKFKPTISIGFALLIALLIGLDSRVGLFLCFSRTVVFFPFFLAGYYFSGKQIEKITKVKSKIASITLMLVIVTLIFFGWEIIDKYGDIIYGGANYNELGMPGGLAILLRILWYGVASAMTLAVMCLIPKRKLAFSYIGSRTLSVYILHRIIRQIFEDLYLYRYFNNNEVLLWAVCIVISLVITYICAAKPFSDLFQKVFKINYDKVLIKQQNL